MKKTIIIVVAIITFFVSIPFIWVGVSEYIYTLREEKYYSDTSNFITDKAVVDNIIYSDRDNSIILWLSEIDEIYQDCNFKINESNTTVVLDSGFREKVHIGDRITYISAPAYFGDGYIMPIVAISVDGIELLSFSEGYKNLMESY